MANKNTHPEEPAIPPETPTVDIPVDEFMGDPERHQAARARNLGYEIQGLEHERNELIADIEGGNNDPGLKARLDAITHDLLLAQKEIIGIQGRIGSNTGDNDIITE